MKTQAHINQAKTRENMRKLREERGYSKSKVVKDNCFSWSYYCNMENGKDNVEISMDYMIRLADYYGIPPEDIVVYEDGSFNDGYNKGYYEGLGIRKALSSNKLDSLSMKLEEIGKSLKSKKSYKSTLYPMLRAMGYTVEVKSVDSCNKELIPSDVLQSLTDDRVFILRNETTELAFWSPKDYYQFEKFVSASVEGNLSKLIAATRKLSRVGFKHKALSKLELKFVSEPVSADMSPKVGNLSFKEIKKMPRLQVKKGFEQDSVRKQLEEVKEVIQGLEYSLDLIENSAASD